MIRPNYLLILSALTVLISSCARKREVYHGYRESFVEVTDKYPNSVRRIPVEDPKGKGSVYGSKPGGSIASGFAGVKNSVLDKQSNRSGQIVADKAMKPLFDSLTSSFGGMGGSGGRIVR